MDEAPTAAPPEPVERSASLELVLRALVERLCEAEDDAEVIAILARDVDLRCHERLTPEDAPAWADATCEDCGRVRDGHAQCPCWRE